MTGDAAGSVRHHDLIIIGSGSGNALVTKELRGLDIAIVERGTFGGTCLNVGCIPTKMFVYPADVVAAAMRADRLGVRLPGASAEWAAVRNRVFARIDPLSDGGRDYRRDDDSVTLYLATARFIGDRRVSLQPMDATEEMPAQITADRVVVATGSRPSMLSDVIGLDRVDPDRGVHTSDTVMRMPTAPDRIAIVGGGTIACEMAHVLAAFGSRVTTVVRGQHLLKNTEPRIAKTATASMRQRTDLRLGVTVRDAVRAGQVWQLRLSDGGRLDVDAVLVAVGRRPNADLLALHPGNPAGIDVAANGRIVVDEYQRTTAPGVFALGDASNTFQQKHVANAEARTVAHNLAHPHDLQATDHRFVPFAIFADPQIAWFGPTRPELDAAGIAYVGATVDYAEVAYGWAMEDTTGFLTVYADPASGQIIAAHGAGYQASMVMQPVLSAATAGIPAHQAARTQYWPHPSLTEVAENALLNLEVNCS